MLELGRRTRPQPYGMKGRFEPLIPRDLRLEVAERMDADGQGRRAARRGGGAARPCRRCSTKGCEALVIHFLHAYANPAHERRAARDRCARSGPTATSPLGHAAALGSSASTSAA